MTLIINPIDIIITAGFLQALLLSIVCLIKGRQKSQLALSFFLFILSFELLVQAKLIMDLIILYPILLPFFNALPCFLSFSFYLYFFFSFYPEYKPKIPVFVHTLPGIMSIVILVIVYFVNGEEYLRTAFMETLEGDLPPVQSIIFFSQVFLGFAYLFLIGRLFFIFRKELKELRKNKKMSKWFAWIGISVASTWTAVLAFGIYSQFAEASPAITVMRSLVQTLFFIWLIYMVMAFALTHPTILEHHNIRDTMKKRLNISSTDVETIMGELNRLMKEEELFSDPNLSLRSLAKELKTNPNVVSFIINEKSPGNFSNFINSYRIDKFLSLAQNESYDSNTLLALALDAGFQSKATFNRTFREIKQTTPSQYLKKNKEICTKS